MFNHSIATEAVSRGADYRASGWQTFDHTAPEYTEDEVLAERSRYTGQTQL